MHVMAIHFYLRRPILLVIVDLSKERDFLYLLLFHLVYISRRKLLAEADGLHMFLSVSVVTNGFLNSFLDPSPRL